MGTRRPLSRNDRRLLRDGQLAADILPVRRGHLVLPATIELVCECDRVVPRSDMRARITEPATGLTVIELIGVCGHCCKATPLVVRFRPDENRAEEWTPRGGWKFVAFRDRRPCWWDLAGWLRRLGRGRRAKRQQ